MQLIKKIFGKGPGPEPGPASESAQFHESEPATDSGSGSGSGSRNATHRELIHVVLRDSMRRHGIPTAWIDCRILSLVSRTQRNGVHVQLVVHDGIDRLLTYVPAFQTSFMEEIARFDPRVSDWLFSMSWEFKNLNAKVASLMPDPALWSATSAAVPLLAATPAPTPAPPPVAVQPIAATPAPTLAPTRAPVAKRPVRGPLPTSASAAAESARDEEVQEDLQALYAIRDAALDQGRPKATGPAAERDFASTFPGLDPDAKPQPPTRW